ncbi:NACHT domain-containing protein [Micromonospora inositola]|uniref:NACHT domain-containing protein n=1 Tax=Micromonospora inositola TaxID=47865 RepID=UPI0038CBF9EC
MGATGVRSIGRKGSRVGQVAFGPLFEGRNVLLGAPGAGKSTMAQKIALDVASADQEGSALVPFLVVLRNFTAEFQQVGRTLDEFLEMQCADPYGLKPPNDAVPYLLQNGARGRHPRRSRRADPGVA